MGLGEKFKDWINPADKYDDVENDPYETDIDDTTEQDYGYGYQQENPQPAPRGGVSIDSTASIELKVVRPEKFESVKQIADHLICNRTVVLNLEATNKETARRMIDFLSGVAYSIEGNLKKVANNTFVITPGTVDVSQDQAIAAAQTTPPPRSDDMYGGF